jgi:hypothetical protein
VTRRAKPKRLNLRKNLFCQVKALAVEKDIEYEYEVYCNRNMRLKRATRREDITGYGGAFVCNICRAHLLFRDVFS